MTYLATKDVQSAEAHNAQPRGLDEADYFLAQFREALATVCRRKFLVAGIAAFVLALAVGLILNAPPVYRSAAQILLDPRGLQVSADDVLPDALSSDIHDTILDTNIRLMTSTTVLERVVSENGLQDDPEFVPGPSRPGRRNAGVTGARTADACWLKRSVSHRTFSSCRPYVCHGRRRSYILTTEVTTNNPQKSAAIASSLIDAFMDEAEKSATERDRASARIDCRQSRKPACGPGRRRTRRGSLS